MLSSGLSLLLIYLLNGVPVQEVTVFVDERMLFTDMFDISCEDCSSHHFPPIADRQMLVMKICGVAYEAGISRLEQRRSNQAVVSHNKDGKSGISAVEPSI